jgi:hypothetical protein
MPALREETIEIAAKITRFTVVRKQFWWLLMIGCVGCHAAVPLPPPVEPPPPPPPVVEAPPPPPKCEKIEEACVAAAETRARIGQIGWQFAPPATWVYAQGEDLTTATSKNAVMGLAVRPVVDLKKERAEREDAMRLVVQKLGMTLPKKKTFIPKKPDQKQKMGNLDVDLYQIEGVKLDGRTGPLLFFVVKATNEQVLVGVGFVADDDSDNADQAIMKAIESLGPAATDGEIAAKKAP